MKTTPVGGLAILGVALGGLAWLAYLENETQRRQREARERWQREQAWRRWQEQLRLQREAEQRRKDEQQAEAYVLHAVQLVAGVLGVPVPPVYFDRCPNAAANRNWICFNLTWAITEMKRSCRSDACTWNRVVAVVAHEFGHHTDPNLRKGHPWADENRADFTAGYVLKKLEVSPTDFFDLMLNWPASDTHPAGFQRIPWVRAGYQRAAAEEPGLLAA